jgi:LEA14-like dessication related protein
MQNEIINKKVLKTFLVVIMIVSIIIIEYFFIVTSLEETIENIKTPDIIVETEFEKLTEEGLEFSVSVNIFNPNNFELKINEFSLVAITDENNNVGSLIIDGGTVKPETSSTFKSKGIVSFEAFDAEVLIFSIDGDATLKIVDYEKTLSLSSDMEVFIPDIQDFIFNNEAVNIEILVQLKIRLRGLLAIVGFKVFNPSEIPIIGKNLVYRIYRLDDDTKTLLVEQDMNPFEISPKTEILVDEEILISYRKFFFSAGFRLLPNWIIFQVEGDLSIAGTRQVLPISINAYFDPHLIRTLDKR